jgi:plasmid stabilization system protein ParE
MRRICWTSLARQDYYDNIDYLLMEWSEQTAQNFIDAADHVEQLLKRGNVEFEKTDMPGVYRCVICSQVSLFYRLLEFDTVELLRFWNNYQKPSDL